MNLLEANKKIKESTLIIRYEDLCETPIETIDKIIVHSDLPLHNFEKIKNYYSRNMHKPTYYTPNFSNQELLHISEITNVTASRFGY